MARTVLVSAGEASGDLYASLLVESLKREHPEWTFFGCTGTRMRAAGVETVVDAHSLAVVGLVEVIHHIPRIYKEFRKLVRAAEARRPDFAILTDAPDFHLRLARKLAARGVPVFYLVAPQVWAWRKGRLPLMQRVLNHLFCIFPFEERFFRDAGVPATYIGHPLTAIVRPNLTREAFFQKHRLPLGRPLVTMLPGSRRGESARHLPDLLDAVGRIGRELACSFVLPASATTGAAFFKEKLGDAPVLVVEGETWDAIAHADVALAASGTVTVEAALLGAPMVTFYRVTGLSWLMGRLLVRVPFYTMVNLVAGRRLVPELMQNEMTGERIAGEALRLLRDPGAAAEMRAGLREVREKLTAGGDPMRKAALRIENWMEEHVANV